MKDVSCGSIVQKHLAAQLYSYQLLKVRLERIIAFFGRCQHPFSLQ